MTQATDIPVLDWQRFASGRDADGFAADLGAACRGPGFFLIKGHGIDRNLCCMTHRTSCNRHNSPYSRRTLRNRRGRSC